MPTARTKRLAWKRVRAFRAIVPGFLSAPFKPLAHAVQEYLKAVFWFIFPIAFPMAVLVLLHSLSEYIVANFPPAFQFVAFVLWGVLLGYMLQLIATEGQRELLFDKLKAFGGFAPVIYSIIVLMMAVIFFAAMTYALETHKVLTLRTPTEPPVVLGSVVEFYLWHFSEAVPLLKVNQTLRWDAPWTKYSALVGWILLLFKIVVIVPVIGAFLGYWNRRPAPPRS